MVIITKYVYSHRGFSCSSSMVLSSLVWFSGELLATGCSIFNIFMRKQEQFMTDSRRFSAEVLHSCSVAGSP